MYYEKHEKKKLQKKVESETKKSAVAKVCKPGGEQQNIRCAAQFFEKWLSCCKQKRFFMDHLFLPVDGNDL